MKIRRIRGAGWLALLGGGEFSFGETEAADRAWLARTPPGKVGFLPAASGSTEYGDHFATYMRDGFDREVEALPIYRVRDGRRGKNRQRIEGVAAVYLGGGVTDQLLAAVHDTPCAEALTAKLASGGVLAAMAAAAQCAGQVARSMFGGGPIAGLGWLPGGVVEPNFDPAHDRRLRQLMNAPAVEWGLGIPARSAVLLGPEGEAEILGTVFVLADADGDFEVLQQGSREND
ncbi:MAG: Type 1 glutamine amidotransferase-like domain-containing protein [Thermoanaerobaculia bacterium]